MTKISDLLSQGSSYSIEMFAPKSEQAELRLVQSLKEFERLRPTFVSITYGAGGSTRDRTHSLVVELNESFPSVAMAHLVCAQHSKIELTEILTKYSECGVENILALRGDDPRDQPRQDRAKSELSHAIDLVELANKISDFCVAIAAHPEGHPESPDLASDRKHLAEKLKIADFGITQFFFRASDYFAMLEDLAALGVNKPIIPGIMPITNYGSISKMAELSGASIPTEIVNRLERYRDDDKAIAKVGVEIACELSQELLDSQVPGLHFYTMNLSNATVEIFENLGLVKR
jgi:methylenetetrahydrofolate reductase (NADPH)